MAEPRTSATRRLFLQTGGVLLAQQLLPRVASAETAPELKRRPRFLQKGWPILQSATDATSASFILQHPAAAKFVIQVSDSFGTRAGYFEMETWNLPSSSFAVTQLSVKGLNASSEYRLEIFSEDRAQIDAREFKCLDPNRNSCRFAVASCMADLMSDQGDELWEALAHSECDFVLLAGDTCYADTDNSAKDEKGYARRYAETRASIQWFRMRKLIPTFATWDDHDFGINNGDRTFQQSSFTRELFKRYWGYSENTLWVRTFGVGSRLELFGQRFYLLDDRSFRDPAGTPLGRHLGSEQTEWLLADLAKEARPSWLVNGSQFFGAYLEKESFEADHPGDFKDFTARLSQVAAPVCFVSGDVHFTEVMEIEPSILGYKTYEFTSSSIHSLTFPYHQHRHTNPRRITSEWRHNFMVFDSKVHPAGDWEIRSRCLKRKGSVSFETVATIQR